MDLLGGYGSGDEDETQALDRPRQGGDNAEVNGHTDFGGNVLQAVQPERETHSVDVAGGLESLPKPRHKKRQLTKLRMQVRAAPDSSESEDEKPKKKLKGTSKGLSIRDFVPAPVNETRSAAQIPVLGGGAAMGASRRMTEDSDEEMAGRDPYQDEMFLGEGSAEEQIFDGPDQIPGNSASEAYEQHPAVMPYEDYSRQGYQSNAGPAIGDSLLAQALQDEAAKAMKDGNVQNPLAGVQFKEINQQKLTYMPPEQKQAKNALRTAFGADHEARVREEAGPKPEKRARSKHQITSLFHQAKMKEMEFIEMKGQAVKTRRETQAKYGWS